VRLGIGGSSSRQELRKNLQLPQATPEALLFFSAPIEREEIARKSKVKQPWHWNSIHQIAFDNVKIYHQKEVVLAYPCFSKPFEIYTDASTL